MVKSMDNDTSDEINPPKTVQELGIHFSYLRNDMKRLTDMIETGTFAKAADLTALDLQIKAADALLASRVQKLEDLWDKITGKIAVSAIVMLVLMVLALYGLDRFFN